MIQAIYNSCISISGSEEKSFSSIVINTGVELDTHEAFKARIVSL